MKNIALFIDGTNNNGRRDKWTSEDTNVWKLYNLCTEKFTMYQKGVGSGREGALGGIGGFGTKERLREAYIFLIDNYESGDSIYLFGFSRGAFAVRVFAGFLGYVGTLFGRPEFYDYLPHIYRFYETTVVLNVVGDRFVPYLNEISVNERDPLPIHFIGAWDTVERYFPTRDLGELKRLPSHIDHARHALSIHERRTEMEPTLWTEWNKTSSMKQMWFPGAHADIGGGYASSKLSEAPLEWMYSEAKSFGLKLSSPIPRHLNSILHQQRTAIPFNGTVLASLQGERTRPDLAAPNPNALKSMVMHKTASDHLLGVNFVSDVEFSNHFSQKDKTQALKDLPAADKAALNLLKQIDPKMAAGKVIPPHPYRRLN